MEMLSNILSKMGIIYPRKLSCKEMDMARKRVSVRSPDGKRETHYSQNMGDYVVIENSSRKRVELTYGRSGKLVYGEVKHYSNFDPPGSLIRQRSRFRGILPQRDN